VGQIGIVKMVTRHKDRSGAYCVLACIYKVPPSDIPTVTLRI